MCLEFLGYEGHTIRVFFKLFLEIIITSFSSCKSFLQAFLYALILLSFKLMTSFYIVIIYAYVLQNINTICPPLIRLAVCMVSALPTGC